MKNNILPERVVSRVSARFSHIIFPFDVRDFITCLSELDYVINIELPPEPAAAPVGRVSGSGSIASKGDFLVDINTEKQFFGVAGGEPRLAWGELLQILDSLESKGFTSREKVAFYELQARYRDRLAKASEQIHRYGESLPLVEKATESFGTKMGLFSTRLFSREFPTDSPNFFELHVEPSLYRPESEIGIRIIYRNSDLAVFEDFLHKYEKSLVDYLRGLFEGRQQA